MNTPSPVTTPQTLASVGLVIGGAAWGVFWIPIRMLEAQGYVGAWSGLVIYLSCVLLLTPIVLLRAGRMRANWRALARCGLITGCAFSLYGISLILTDVIRSVLLFYLTPLWSTALGYFLLGERISPARIFALILAAAGLIAIVGFSGSTAAINLGDAMALLSGLLWAIGSLFLFNARDISVPEQVFSFTGGALIVTGVFLIIAGPGLSEITLPSVTQNLSLIGLTALLVLPMLFLTLWPATLLSPGRVGLLLMSEVVVGVITAAFWSGDPFGMSEAIGSVLIVSAGLVEVLGNRPTPKASQA